jgi:hypothetical protein
MRERVGQHALETTRWRPPEPHHLFSLDIEEASFIQYSGEGHRTVKHWHVGRAIQEKVRRWTGSGYVDE